MGTDVTDGATVGSVESLIRYIRYLSAATLVSIACHPIKTAIATEDNIRAYIHRQHRLGVTEAGAWSRLLPMPNCPGKVMSILNTTLS